MNRFSLHRWFAVALFVVLMIVLTACGGGPPVTSWPGMVVHGNIAYVASSDQITAIDVSPGTAAAKRQLQGWPYKPTNTSVIFNSQPAISPDGKTLYVGADPLSGNAGMVIALNDVSPGPANTITPKWTYPVTQTDPNPGNVYGGIVLVSDTVYFAGGNGLLFALDAESGRPRWNQPFDPGTGVRIWSSPVVHGNLVLVASQDHHLYAVDKADGHMVWKYPKDGAPAIGTLAGSPGVYDDTIYVGSFDEYLYALDLNGNEKWRFHAGGSLWDPPAESDGILFLGDLNGNVYALGLNGKEKWSQPARVEGGVRATPLVADGVLYVGTDQHKMYALDATTGLPIPAWPKPFTARDGEMLLVRPAIYSDTLIVLPNLATADPIRLYGVSKATGDPLWRFPPQSQ